MDTSFFSHLNWLAVGVAAVAYFLLGALWYSKLLFANQWIKGTGIDVNKPDAKKGVGGVMFFTLVLEFIICIGIGVLVYRLGLAGQLMSGVKLGLMTGLLFCVPVITISYLYQSKTSLSFIDGGYHLVGNIIAAVIICSWP